nr:hypothetical protein CFP56_24830 [Quercus suber]
MVSLNDPFWTFDFDNAYFDSNDDGMENSGCGDDMDVSDCDHDMDVSNCDHDMDIDANTDSDYDSEEDEFWIVFPLVRSYYLVDSRYPIGASFLPPHKSTRYHAQEFRMSNRQSASGKELYNYIYSSLRMVIEKSFGVLKARFPS